ncbi:MAG: glycosyltransferase family 2 protein [Planctomycetota bacterium]
MSGPWERKDSPGTCALTGLSVVAPVRNEEGNIEPLVQEIVAALSKIPVPGEILFVDDGSTDGTAQRLRGCMEKCECLRVVTLPGNRGQSWATWVGVRQARMSHVATLDGDMQNDPADLVEMVKRVGEYDVVIGRRRTRQDSWRRRAASRLANTVQRIVLRDGVRDTGCSVRVFPREVFLALPAFRGMHRFLPALFLYQGMRMLEMEVNHRPRRSGRAKYGTLSRAWTAFTDLLGMVWLTRRTICLLDRQGKPTRGEVIREP